MAEKPVDQRGRRRAGSKALLLSAGAPMSVPQSWAAAFHVTITAKGSGRPGNREASGECDAHSTGSNPPVTGAT
jgi:hypothetical protein